MRERVTYVNSKIKLALATGALPYRVVDDKSRDAAIRTLVSREGKKRDKKYTVNIVEDGVWIIDIA